MNNTSESLKRCSRSITWNNQRVMEMFKAEHGSLNEDDVVRLFNKWVRKKNTPPDWMRSAPQSTETETAEETIVIGNRLRESGEAKELPQGDIEKRTGLLRCYISRVENNHTVPAVDTLEKLARALEIPMYQLFHVRRLPMYRTEC